MRNPDESPVRRSPRLAGRYSFEHSSSPLTRDTSSRISHAPAKSASSSSASFGGSLTKLVLIFGLPACVLLLNLFVEGKASLTDGIQTTYFLTSLNVTGPSLRVALYLVLGWLLFVVLLEWLLPAETIEGSRLPNGLKLKYRINGHLSFWVAILVVCHGNQVGQWIGLVERNNKASLNPLVVVSDLFLPICVATFIIATMLSVFLFCVSFRRDAQLTKHVTGDPISDFWMGRELNPRWSVTSPFDIKFHCMLRPGLIGWLVLNIACGAKQHQDLGFVTSRMTLLILFQAIYVWDALFHESAALTTMDITTEGFGYMLVFGDLVWVPFTYTLQARYLLGLGSDAPQLSRPAAMAITSIFFGGYSIFRLANNQKNIFRNDPYDSRIRHLLSFQTGTGRRLLVTGWWGAARKINYTGDWLMGLSWCLLCGFESILPYFYAIYFFILLVHRSERDDADCFAKYGRDWEKYKKKVPYRFIPHLF